MKKIITTALVLVCLPFATSAQYEDLKWSTKKGIAFCLPTDDLAKIKPKDYGKLYPKYEIEWGPPNVMGLMLPADKYKWGPDGYVDVFFENWDQDYAYIIKDAKEKLLETAEVNRKIEAGKKAHAEYLEFNIYVRCVEETAYDLSNADAWRIWLLNDADERVYPVELTVFEGYPTAEKEWDSIEKEWFVYYESAFMVRFENSFGDKRPERLRLIMAGELGQRGFEWIFDKNPK
jgi:hypothetical protein